MRRLLLLLAVLLAVLLGVRLRWSRDALAQLPRAAGPRVVQHEVGAPEAGRTLHRVRLEDAALGPITLTLSLPAPLPAQPLPVLFVLGGLRRGQAVVEGVGTVGGDNVLVGYDWPLPRQLPSGLALVREMPALRRQALRIPGQVAAAMRWAAAQPWADSRRVSLLGFSLGAIAGPAIQRMAADEGVALRATVFGYGGAGLHHLVREHPFRSPAPVKWAYAQAARLLLRPMEPAEHLPHLRGRLLLIRARGDRLLSPRAADLMEALAPRPYDHVVLEGEHLGVGRSQRERLEAVVGVARAWLVAEGAANPAPTPP